MKYKKIGVFIIIIIMFIGSLIYYFNYKDDKVNIKIILGSEPMVKFMDALRNEFPNINFEFEQYKGSQSNDYFDQLLKHDETGDIYFISSKNELQTQREHLLDLSGYEFMGNYEKSILSQFENDGRIYLIPGPVNLRTLAYNKSLFEEKGWKVPKNHNEIIELCKKIRKETDITPITMNSQLPSYYYTLMSSYAQCDFLPTPDGKKWEQKYFDGKASIGEGFSQGIEILQDFIDADAYDFDNKLTNTDVISKLVNRQVAMAYIWFGQSDLVKIADSCKDEVALLPFYGHDGSLLITNSTQQFGIPKRMEKPENKEKLEAILEIMEWISSQEGQESLIKGSTDIIPIKGVTTKTTSKIYQKVWIENINSYKEPILYSGYTDVMVKAGQYLNEKIANKQDISGVIKLIDEEHKIALNEAESLVVGTSERTMTHEETVQTIANLLDNANFGDFALVSSGRGKDGARNKFGVNGNIFGGDISGLTPYIMFSSTETYLVNLFLTGKQIKAMIEQGKAIENDYGTEKVYFDYYWSGIDVKIEDGKVKSIKLDGNEMDLQKTYKVTFLQGDYEKSIENSVTIENTNVIASDLYLELLKKQNPLKPPKVLRK